jgi:membrane associated rhomboid family serine protease
MTLIIVALTVVISLYCMKKPSLQNRLMMNPYMIAHKGQYERLLTSGFIHVDHMHLIFNMFSLYFLGSAVERDMVILFGQNGIWYFGALYLIAIAVSDLPTFLRKKNTPGYNSLGASGGVCAVVFAFIVLQPTQYLCLFLGICMPGFILGTLYVVYSYVQARQEGGHINHDAHLFGSLFGILFCAVIYPHSIVSFYQKVTHWFGTF